MANIYKFGIEEEFFLVDADTKSAARAMPAAFLQAAQKATGGQVSGELLQSQVEIATLPHTDMATARTELRFLRQTVAEIAVWQAAMHIRVNTRARIPAEHSRAGREGQRRLQFG